MGKIQSAVTGALLTSIGAVASQAESAKKAASTAIGSSGASNESANLAEISKSEGINMYAKAYEESDQSQRDNLIKRQDEARDIAKKYADSQTFQREAFKQRLEKLGGITTPRGKKFDLAARAGLLKNAQLHQAKMNELKNPKKGDK